MAIDVLKRRSPDALCSFFYSYGSVSVFEVGIGFSVFFSVFL